MNDNLIIAAIVIALTFIMLYFTTKNSKETKKEEIPSTKFEPRNITDFSTKTSSEEKESVISISTEIPLVPKKKYYKKKKKKTSNTQVEKRPVGRPRKTTE